MVNGDYTMGLSWDNHQWWDKYLSSMYSMIMEDKYDKNMEMLANYVSELYLCI